MADTKRSLADLITLLTSATPGDISAQDLRDFLVSAFSGYGFISVLAGSTAQGSLSGTPAKLTCFAANGVASSDVTPDHTNDQITVGVAGDYAVSFNASVVGTASKAFQFRIYVNGVITTIGCEQEYAATEKYQNIGCRGILTLAATDIVTVMVSSDDGGTSITVSDAQLVLKRVG